jgi:hypothetical protein
MLLARTPSGLWFLCQASDGNERWLYRDWLDKGLDPLGVPTLPPTKNPVVAVVNPQRHPVFFAGPV